jgi:hypothetical protein
VGLVLAMLASITRERYMHEPVEVIVVTVDGFPGRATVGMRLSEIVALTRWVPTAGSVVSPARDLRTIGALLLQAQSQVVR